MTLWTAVIVGGLACYALKLAGLSVPDRMLENPRLRRVAALLPVALLMALTVTQAFVSGDRLVLDARAAGLAAAAVAVALRAPFLLVIVLASGTTAMVRALA